ncbi:MAG: amino acid transporter [archaeon]|nr:amino acid transporter [archaeon]
MDNNGIPVPATSKIELSATQSPQIQRDVAASPIVLNSPSPNSNLISPSPGANLITAPNDALPMVTLPGSAAEEKPKEEPSVVGTAFLLANMCFGTAIFTFAIRCKFIGLVWFLVLVLLGGIANYWTILRLVKVSLPFKERDYGTLVKRISGKVAGVVIDVFTTLYSLMVVLSCTCSMFQGIGRFIEVIFKNGEYETWDEFKDDFFYKSYVKFPIIIVLMALLFPMAVLRNLSKLNFTGYIGVFAIFFGILVVAIQCNEYYNYYKDNEYFEDDDETHVNWVKIGKSFTKDLEFFKGASTLFFAYSIHNGILPCFMAFPVNEVGYKKFRISTFFGMLIVFCLSAVSSVVSYLTEPLNPEDVIVFRKPIHSGYDVLMSIAKVSFVLAQFFTIPPYVLTFRLGVENLFRNKVPFTTPQNVIFTIVSLLAVGIIVVVYDKILNYMNYAGGFLCVVFCYFFPIYLWVITSEKKWKYWLNIVEMIFSLLLCAIGIIAGVATIIQDAS